MMQKETWLLLGLICSVWLLGPFLWAEPSGKQPLSSDNLKSELSSIQLKKIEVFEETKQLTAQLAQYEEKLAALGQEQTKKTQEISQIQEEIRAALPILLRLNRTNPLRLLVEPNKSTYLTHGRVVIRSLAKVLAAKAEENRLKIGELKNLAHKIALEKQVQSQLLQSLRQQAEELENQSREKINIWQTSEQQRLRNHDLSVNDLLSGNIDNITKQGVTESGFPFSTLSLPVNGKKSAFSEHKTFSPHSKGITVKTAKSAKVWAPADGQIVYIGPFRKQKEILIIDHGQKTHSVLMGFDKLRVTVGQTVYDGEEIGYMAGHGAQPPKLYFELRKSGKAVDPTSFFQN